MADIVDHRQKTEEVVRYNFKQAIANQYHMISPVLLKIYVPITLLFVFIIIFSSVSGIAIGKFTQDPNDFSHINPLIGIISNFGVLFWCASATVCFFGAAFRKIQFHKSSMPLFLLCSGIITCILLFDDFFLFHDWIVIYYLHLGKYGEYLTFLSYLIITIAYLIFFRKLILKTDFLLLLLGLGLFALSLGIDFFTDITNIGLMEGFFENVPKFFGIVTWFAYFSRLCFQYIKSIELTHVQ